MMCLNELVPASKQELCVSIPNFTLRISGWWLEIGRGGSVYTMEISKIYRSEIHSQPKAQTVKYLPAHNCLKRKHYGHDF